MADKEIEIPFDLRSLLCSVLIVGVVQIAWNAPRQASMPDTFWTFPKDWVEERDPSSLSGDWLETDWLFPLFSSLAQSPFVAYHSQSLPFSGSLVTKTLGITIFRPCPTEAALLPEAQRIAGSSIFFGAPERECGFGHAQLAADPCSPREQVPSIGSGYSLTTNTSFSFRSPCPPH